MVEGLLALLPGPAAVRSGDRHLAGDPAATGSVVPIHDGGERIGEVVGPAGVERAAEVVQHLVDREVERRALADETLGRYKELTLLYDMSEKLSKLLHLDELARAVVDDARRHLRATGAALLLHDARQGMLEAVAWVGPEFERTRRLVANRGVEGRVLETGRAEFIEDVAATESHVALDAPVGSLIVAPLRVGERVFGVLRVTKAVGDDASWTAGELKLVTAMAAHAASAISNAQLHTEQLREQALRHRVERYLSPLLLDAVFDDGPPSREAPLVVACCDLRRLGTSEREDAEQLLRTVERGLALAVRGFLDADAVVDTPQGDLVVAVFRDPEGLNRAAKRAVGAAGAIAAGLSRVVSGVGGHVPGVGLAATRVLGSDPQALFQGINAAAVLQGEAEGRVVIDAETYEAVRPTVHCQPLGTRALPSGPTEVFEVAS